MPRLLVADQIACTTNVKVVARQLEAGTQAVEVAQYLQTFFGGFGKRAVHLGR